MKTILMLALVFITQVAHAEDADVTVWENGNAHEYNVQNDSLGIQTVIDYQTGNITLDIVDIHQNN